LNIQQGDTRVERFALIAFIDTFKNLCLFTYLYSCHYFVQERKLTACKLNPFWRCSDDNVTRVKIWVLNVDVCIYF